MKKDAALQKGQDENFYEINSGGKEIAAMMLMLIIVNDDDHTLFHSFVVLV